MKVLVTGSRTMGPEHYELVKFELLMLLALEPLHIIQGGASGADNLAKRVATVFGFPVDEYPADWERYGKAAGSQRNQQMLNQKPDLVLAFYPTTGITPGTKDMVTRAYKASIPVKTVQYVEVPECSDGD